MSLSLRPLVVRFADPSVEDAHVDVIYERVKQEDERVWPQLYDITVKDLKARLCAMHASMQGRRLRLIYFGRVLPNGVRLAPWIDALMPTEDPVTLEQMHVERVMHDAMYELRPTASRSGEEVRIARLPTVFLQCSVGSSVTVPRDDDDPLAGRTTHEPRGFDRLRHTAGMSDLDIQVMREQFHRRSGLLHSGDVLRRTEEEDMAYTMEEQWIDNMGQHPLEQEAWWAHIVGGLLLGFLFPLMPLFFMYEPKPLVWSRQLQRRQAAASEERSRELESLLQQLSDQIRQQPVEAPQRERIDEAQASLDALLDRFRRRRSPRVPPSSSDEEEEDDEEEAGPEPSARLPRLGVFDRNRYLVFSQRTYFCIVMGLIVKYVWVSHSSILVSVFRFAA